MDEQAPPPDTSAFPAEGLAWLVGPAPRRVLVLGSAALADALSRAGHDVLLQQPDEHPPTVGQHSIDVVVAHQRVPEDLMEVARVLRPGGQLALAVTDRDHRIPWARKLDLALDIAPDPDPEAALIASSLFGFVDEATHKAWQSINRDGLVALVRALPELAGLGEPERAARTAAAVALYDDYGRGADGMQLPWLCRCFRATVVEDAYVAPRPAEAVTTPDNAPGPADPTTGQHETGQHEYATDTWVGEDTQPIGTVTAGPMTPPGGRFTFHAGEFDDTGMLLIDLR